MEWRAATIIGITFVDVQTCGAIDLVEAGCAYARELRFVICVYLAGRFSKIALRCGWFTKTERISSGITMIGTGLINAEVNAGSTIVK